MDASELEPYYHMLMEEDSDTEDQREDYSDTPRNIGEEGEM